MMLYITIESVLNKPKPIPMFQIKSKFMKSFTKYVLSLKFFKILNFRSLSKIKIVTMIIKFIIFSFFNKLFLNTFVLSRKLILKQFRTSITAFL